MDLDHLLKLVQAAIGEATDGRAYDELLAYVSGRAFDDTQTILFMEEERQDLRGALREAIRMAHPSTSVSYTEDAKREKCAELSKLCGGEF